MAKPFQMLSSQVSATFVGVLLVLALSGLFRANVTANEVTKFTDALASFNPSWIPGLLPGNFDPGRRQWLFQLLTGPLLFHFGFLFTSISGRIISYSLYAWGFARLGKTLRIHPVLVAAVAAAMDLAPSIVAQEWLFRGFEPKSIAYPLLFLAISYALEEKPRPKFAAFLCGLASSFHPLVGLYGSFALGGALLITRRFAGIQQILQALGIFAASSIFALRPIADKLLAPQGADQSAGGLPSSYIYVYLRAAHHLDPSWWDPAWWRAFAAYLLAAGAAFAVLRGLFHEKKADLPAVFCGLTLLPFLSGLSIASFDTNGRLLQFYLFRAADVVLPFTTYLLGALIIQRGLLEHAGAVMRPVLWLLLVCFLGVRMPGFIRQASALASFPGPAQGVSSAYLDLAHWAARSTSASELFIVPPLGFETFPWLAGRRIACTFKQTNLSGGLQKWYEKMTALGNLRLPWQWRGLHLAAQINSLYQQHSTGRVKSLLSDFKADYFVTFAGHSIELDSVYRNSEYAVYSLGRGTPR